MQHILQGIAAGEAVFERQVSLAGDALFALMDNGASVKIDDGGTATVSYDPQPPTTRLRNRDASYPLTCEPIAFDGWGVSLKRMMRPCVWDRLRFAVYEQCGRKCAICGTLGRLNCHEVWNVNEKRHTSELVALTALCDLCHHVKHIGLAEKLGRQGRLNFELVVQHFMRVNNCTRADFEAHHRDVMNQWRSRRNWTIDFGEFSDKVSHAYGREQPSTATSRAWLYAERQTGAYPASTADAGKWLVFVPENSVDALWQKIRTATERGLLGNSAKVTTAVEHDHAISYERVICVYTYNWRDALDVRRIRGALRELGVIERIPYKTDADTRRGLYSATGRRRIPKYYE